MRNRGLPGLVASLIALGAIGLAAQLRAAGLTKAELQEELKDHDIVGDWNYDDIDGAFRIAAKTGKPVLVVFR